MKLSNKKNIKVGKIIEPKGLRGEVKVVFFSGDASWARDIEVLELVDPHSGHKSTHKVVKISPTSHPDRVCFKISGVDDRNSSEKINGWEVYVSENLFESSQGEEVFLREVLDFEIFDQEKLIGKVYGFDSNGVQDLLLVKGETGEEVIIPFVKAFILKSDFKNKKIIMDLPPGLLDINRAL